MFQLTSTFRAFLPFSSQSVRTLVLTAVFTCLLLGISPDKSLSLTQQVQAAEVTVAGYTNGCFNCAAPPNTSATQTATILGLTYTNSTFSGTTAGGFLAFGGNPQPSGIQNVDNLGSFTLANSTATYNGNTFTLRVTFTVPTGINGGGSRTYAATLTGTVTSTGNGGVFLDFNNTPQLFTFSFVNGQGQTVSGSFFFVVNDLSINPGQVGPVSGQITAASLSPTAATVSVGGYVTTITGRGITGVLISLTDSQGNTRTTVSTTSGYYRFDDVEAGSTYIITATGKRYWFSQPSQLLNVNDESDDVNFIANPIKRYEM